MIGWKPQVSDSASGGEIPKTGKNLMDWMQNHRDKFFFNVHVFCGEEEWIKLRYIPPLMQNCSPREWGGEGVVGLGGLVPFSGVPAHCTELSTPLVPGQGPGHQFLNVHLGVPQKGLICYFACYLFVCRVIIVST